MYREADSKWNAMQNGTEKGNKFQQQAVFRFRSRGKGKKPRGQKKAQRGKRGHNVSDSLSRMMNVYRSIESYYMHQQSFYSPL